MSVRRSPRKFDARCFNFHREAVWLVHVAPTSSVARHSSEVNAVFIAKPRRLLLVVQPLAAAAAATATAATAATVGSPAQ